MKNLIAKELINQTKELGRREPPIRVTDFMKLKYIFFSWLLSFDVSEIFHNDEWKEEIPTDWYSTCPSYTIRYRSRTFYVGFLAFPSNFGFNIVIQDSILLQCIDSRSIYELPTHKEELSNDEKKEYSLRVGRIMGVFSTYFTPFLDRAVEGKKPMKRAHGSSSSSVS